MGKSSRMDKTTSGFWFWLAILVLAFGLYSLTIALTTADDCGEGADKEWIIFPPEWECNSRPGFG
jgi:hypothetical protein